MIRCALIFALVAAGAYAAPHRIVNGTDAGEGEFPFAVSLLYKGSFTCGASIIDKSWILTAAHCVSGDSPSSLSIIYGTNQNDGKANANVSRIIVHQNYSSFYLNDDIAVLQLAAPIVLSARAQPVRLPTQRQVTPNGAPAVLVGWGLNATGGSLPNNLQKVDLTIVDAASCNKIHSNEVYESNICAGVPGGGKGQCSGDSGGPLLVDGIQRGIVSWSEKPCTIAPYPGVFTQVAYFRDWIKTQTGV